MIWTVEESEIPLRGLRGHLHGEEVVIQYLGNSLQSSDSKPLCGVNEETEALG